LINEIVGVSDIKPGDAAKLGVVAAFAVSVDDDELVPVDLMAPSRFGILFISLIYVVVCCVVCLERSPRLFEQQNFFFEI